MRNSRGWQGFVVAVALATTVGCGGGDGGGDGGRATVTGNVSNAATTTRESTKSTWLAWIGEEVLGLARRAYAQASNALGGISVTVSRGSSTVNDVTDDDGDFDVPGAPSGDVTVTFTRGNCDADIVLPDVADGSTIDLQDVTFACNSASPGKVAETFQAVILNKPGSVNGNLNVCAFGGGGNHTRAVKVNEADFLDTPFADLQEGDIIEVTGERAGNGANSTMFAATVSHVGEGSIGNCASIPTPTPENTATPTPEGTAEPTATPTATPTP